MRFFCCCSAALRGEFRGPVVLSSCYVSVCLCVRCIRMHACCTANRTFLVILDPELARVVLGGSHTAFPKSDRYEAMECLVGRGLITANGDEWKTQRSQSQTSFIITSYLTACSSLSLSPPSSSLPLRFSLSLYLSDALSLLVPVVSTGC